ncbi:MAG TPA: 5'-nucleotidase C-terminal domain-containing protein [Pyrinomonadaceae bacterium]|nr:5'-nucleotidase C-terminal domain-containing protein [Pyrinomonadaceae bacterium]
MPKSVAKIVSLRWLSLLLLLISAPLALAQQPAPAGQPPAAKPQAPASLNVNARVTETLIDSSIKDDPAVDKMLAVYGPKVRALDVIIGKLKGELRKGGTGAGSLGNFVADGMRAEASIKLGKPVDLAIMNGGGLRRNTVGEGDVRARDIFELLPFENALVTLDLTGEQVLKLLGVVVSSHEAQSGARITYIIKADKSSALEAAKLLTREIEPKATYTVVTIDYLVNVGGDRYAVLREGKNTQPLGITLRDAIMDYVKAETAAGRDIKPNLDGRFVLDRANSVLSGEAPPK